MRKRNSAHASNTQVKVALKKNAGVIVLAAKDLNLTRQALWMRVKKSPELQEFISDIEESLLDAAESVVINAIVKDKDVSTAKWVLERKGKSRGYANKAEVENRLRDEDLQALIAAFGGDTEKLRRFRAALDPSTPR